MTPKARKQKGNLFEIDVVDLHKEVGIDAERVYASGNTQSERGDVRIRINNEKFIGECKRKRAGTWRTMLSDLGPADMLFLREDHHEGYVFMPLSQYARLVRQIERAREAGAL